MTLTRHPLLSALLLVACLIAGALAVESLVRIHDVYAEGPPAAIDAGQPAAALDAGPAAASDKPALPPPADPVATPTAAIDGFRLWLKTGWPFAMLFCIGSALIAAGARIKRLRTGKAAIAIGTAVAAITVILTAKAAGMSNAQSVAGAMNVLLGGFMWAAWPNRSTVDLSTATPAQIAEALAAAQKPPAFPPANP